MPTEVDDVDLFVELAELTSMSPEDWRDFCSLPPAAQEVAAQAYREASWAKSADALPKVLGILGVIGAVAGAVTGVAGATGAAVALRGAFK